MATLRPHRGGALDVDAKPEAPKGSRYVIGKYLGPNTWTSKVPRNALMPNIKVTPGTSASEGIGPSRYGRGRAARPGSHFWEVPVMRSQAPNARCEPGRSHQEA